MNFFCGFKSFPKIKIDSYDSLTCPWNDPVNSILNTLSAQFPQAQYSSLVKQASLPIYQPSALIPLSCFNSDTSRVHVSLDQLSYQFGQTRGRNQTERYPINDSFYYIGFQDINSRPIILGQIYESIPNQAGNVTRLFTRNVNDTVSGKLPYDFDRIKNVYNTPPSFTVPVEREIDPGTRLAVFQDGLKAETLGFPFQSIDMNWDGFLDIQNITNSLTKNPYDYYQVATGPVMSISCDGSILNSYVPGCDQLGCQFMLSVTSCYQNSLTSLSSINGSDNSFYTDQDKDISGCGVVVSECYKVSGDPYYKAMCCRNSFTAAMLDLSSLSLNPYPVHHSVTFASAPTTQFSYSAHTMYCEPSWIAGSPTCDVSLQDFCATQVSTITVGGQPQVIHAVLDSQNVCGQWYASLMQEYATYFFTQRNVDVISNIFVQYCATNGLAEQVGDTQSCACINSFYGNGRYYYPDPIDPSKAFPVVGAASQTDRDLLFTDPVCGSVECPTDPNFFTFSSDPDSTMSTVVTPEIILQKRKCPKNICASILGNESIDINNFSGATEIDIANFTNTCYVTESGGPPTPRTISSQYYYSVQARDDSPPLCGRFQYSAQDGTVTDGAAGFNLQFFVTGDPISNLFYSITGYASQYFEFSAGSGTFTQVQMSSTANLTILKRPFGLPPLLDGKSSYVDSFQVTLQTSQTNGTASSKSFPVSILMFPDGPLPPEPSNLVPTKPLPQQAKTVLSKSSLALIVLSLVFLAYALGFFVETVQIRNLIAGVRDLMP